MKFMTASPLLIALIASCGYGAAITKTYNENGPEGLMHTAQKVGWYWTADETFVWTGLEAKFGLTIPLGANVTAEIYSVSPSPANLLRSFEFVPLSLGFAGGNFAAIDVTLGDEFFIGFNGVNGLGGLSPVSLPGGTDFGPVYYSFLANGNYELSDGGGNFPRLRFTGNDGIEEAVPEPGTLGLIGCGICLMLFRTRKRNG